MSSVGEWFVLPIEVEMNSVMKRDGRRNVM
jgi:hypothetical protein